MRGVAESDRRGGQVRESARLDCQPSGTTPAGLDRILERIRMISLGESANGSTNRDPQLLATLARLQGDLLDAGLLTAPTPFEPLLRWPSTLGPSSCRR